jgi:hypothetical protein
MLRKALVCLPKCRKQPERYAQWARTMREAGIADPEPAEEAAAGY